MRKKSIPKSKPTRERIELSHSELKVICRFFGIMEENLDVAHLSLIKKLLAIEKSIEEIRFPEITIK